MTKAREIAELGQNLSVDASGNIDVNGSVTANTVSVDSNLTVGGTVDGRDVAADGTKLDGIEAGATADQTAGEIKTAYESNADTNAFTDAEQTKLAGIEASADVTDTANVTAAGALMDSELADIAAIKALDQGVATTDVPTFTNTQLAEIAATISDTAVDVFVYDTRKDSDGGAWRKRTQHTSWYNETLNTATRGSRKEFPSVAVIVVHSLSGTGKVTIYDGDDPDLPMWMVLNGNSSATDLIPSFSGTSLSCVAAMNGTIMVGNSTYDLSAVSFIEDTEYRWSTTAKYRYNGNIAQRSDGLNRIGVSSFGIANRAVNDVAMTVLPNAPIDAATGLPVPTIAVATDGGVSVIKDDGTVVDINSVAVTNYIEFSEDYKLSYLDTAGADDLRVWYYPKYLEDGSTVGYSKIYWETTTPSLGVFDNTAYDQVPVGKGKFASGTFDGVALVQDNGLEGQVSSSNNPQDAVTYVTSTYNTGWMNGDIKLATLSDTDDTDVTGSELVTNGTFDSDTSGWTDASTGTGSISWNSSGYLQLNSTDSSNRAIAKQSFSTEVGKTYTFTFEQVAGTEIALRLGTTDTGSQYYNHSPDEVGVFSTTFTATTTTLYITIYGPQSSANTQVDNISVRLAEEDRSVNGNGLQVFGTVTKNPVNSGADLVAYSGFSGSNYLVQPYNSDLAVGTGDICAVFWYNANSLSGTTRWLVDQGSTGFEFAIANGTVFYNLVGGQVQYSFTSTSTWNCVALVRRNGVLYAYMNGELVGTASATGSVTATSGTFFGIRSNLDANRVPDARLALLRISATAPSPEQIKKIYEDEKVLFQENAQATLYGSSDAVTALAYDDSTELLHVGTSAGRSVFQGLRRVDNTTTAVGAAISASNGLVADE